MKHKGDKRMKKSGSSSDALSPQSGKRLRDEKYVKAGDSDLPINYKSGKRVKCDGSAANVSKKDQALTSGIEEGSSLFCSTCCVNSTSEKDYDTHIAGKKHAKAITGLVTPRSSEFVKRKGMESKNVPMKLQTMVDGSITDFDQAGKGSLSSCTGCTHLEAVGLLACSSPDKNVSKDMVLEEQDPKVGILVESLGSQTLKNGPTGKVALHDQGDESFVQLLTNGHHVHNASADDQNNKSLLDSAICKSTNSIARALAAAYQACACAGLEGLKSGTPEQAAEGALSQVGGMVSMHTDCFMNLLHDVQVKAMEDLFLYCIREGKVGGFTMESCLPNSELISTTSPDKEELNCMVCRVEYGSKADLERHVTGKKHISVVTRSHCKCLVCNVNCNSEKDFENHVSGKKHASKVRLVQKRAVL